MPGKIFVNYRRDDERAFAARVRDRLAQAFGGSNVFMDVDNLMAGQRFDRELEKALVETDVFLAVMGPRWLDLYQQRQASGERDYVHEEIAGALKRGITVVPVLIEGATLPRGDLLPEDIRELVLHQKHGITHENFGRDVVGLVEAIKFARRRVSAKPVAVSLPWGWLGAGALTVLALGYIGAAQLGMPVPWPAAPSTRSTDDGTSITDAEARAKQLADTANKAKRDQDAREKAARDEAARKKVEDDARVKAAADNMRPGRVFRDCNDGCPEMVVVPAGRFRMGEDNSARDVTIQQPFAVGKFEVTFDEWAACVAGGGCQSNRSPSDRGWEKGRRPVINVSWNDAKEYVAWLSRKTGKTYRLLTESEWEYAARAGTTTAYWWGDKFDGSRANNNGSQTVPVGQYAANAFGLYDMHGNVWEWCEDAYDASSRVIRGGSWSDRPDGLRSSFRYRFDPDFRGSFLGFRVARVLSPARTP